MHNISKVLLGLSLSITSINALASGCVNQGSIKHITMRAQLGTVNLSGNVKRFDEIKRVTFRPDSTVPAVAECANNSTVHAYASYSKDAGMSAQYYTQIDGMPTYYTPGSFEYAYALIDNQTGLPFRHNPGQEIPVKSQFLNPRNATLIFYATKDNPTKTTYFDDQYFGVLLATAYGSSAGNSAVGFSYKVGYGSINPPKASCTTANSSNLSIQLPRSPLSAFPEVGSSYATAKDQFAISCTGNISATMKLNLGADQVALDTSGQATVIKNKLDTADAAQGIGFVLNDQSGKRLKNNEVIRLASLSSGLTQIPIYAKYYRYADHIKPGRTEATAGFTLSFN